MKAVLVLDMPKSCIDCPLAYKEGYSIYRCKMSEDQVDPNSIYRECPLKPLPELRHKEKYAYTYELTYDQGYNRAIKEITGEAEKADAENQWWAEHSSRFD